MNGISIAHLQRPSHGGASAVHVCRFYRPPAHATPPDISDYYLLQNSLQVCMEGIPKIRPYFTPLQRQISQLSQASSCVMALTCSTISTHSSLRPYLSPPHHDCTFFSTYKNTFHAPLSSIPPISPE